MNGRTAPGHAVQAEGTGRRRFLTRTVLGTAGTVASWFISRSYGWALAPAAEELVSPPPTISPQQRRSHEDYMRRAIAPAKQVPRLPFGAVIVQRATGEIVAEGFNRSSESPTFHGEIDAINRCAGSTSLNRLDRIGSLHDRGTLPHVSERHRVGRHCYGLLRYFDPVSERSRVVADRHPGRRGRSPNTVSADYNCWRHSRIGV